VRLGVESGVTTPDRSSQYNPEGAKEALGDAGSVGLVQPQTLELPEGLTLESGDTLAPLTVAYETYGALAPDRRNAVLVCHALSGDAHAAGKHALSDEKTGWYDLFIGPGKALDTDRLFVICSNVIGGCRGSTGPASINPRDPRGGA